MKQDEMTICECIEYLDSMVGDDENIKGCLDYIERKAKAMDKRLRDYKSIFEEEHPLDGNSFNFSHFKQYSNSTLKRMTKDELIDHINILYINWKSTDNTCERISRLAKQLYEKAKEDKEAKEPLYRLRQNEYYILLDYKGNLGNKPINRYVSLLEIKKYGLFRNVPDNVPINEILRNCEVIK